MTFKKLFADEPPKRKLAPITAAEIKRILAMNEVVKEPYRQNRLWLSSIFYNTATDFVLDYWLPKPYKQTWESTFRTMYGDVIHEKIQEYLHAKGALFPQYGSGKYREVRIEDPRYKISGKLDGLIPREYVKALGASREKEIPRAEDSELLHFEIKTISSGLYKKISTPADISEGYKSQAAITQRIIKKPGTLFLYVDTGSLQMKTLWYEGEDRYWDDACALSDTVFDAIENETLPLPPGKREEDILGMPFADWLADIKSRQPEWENWSA